MEPRDPIGLHMMTTITPSSHWGRALLLQLGLDPCEDFSKVFLTDFVLQSLEAKPVPQLAPCRAGGTTHMTQSQITPGNWEGDPGEQLEQAELCGREEAVLGRISAGGCHGTHTHTLCSTISLPWVKPGEQGVTTSAIPCASTRLAFPEEPGGSRGCRRCRGPAPGTVSPARGTICVSSCQGLGARASITACTDSSSSRALGRQQGSSSQPASLAHSPTGKSL